MKQLEKVKYQVSWESNDGELTGCHFDCEAATVPGAMAQVRNMLREVHGLMAGEYRVLEVYRI